MKTIKVDSVNVVDIVAALGGWEPVLAGAVGLAIAWFVWWHWPDVGP